MERKCIFFFSQLIFWPLTLKVQLNLDLLWRRYICMALHNIPSLQYCPTYQEKTHSKWFNGRNTLNGITSDLTPANMLMFWHDPRPQPELCPHVDMNYTPAKSFRSSLWKTCKRTLNCLCGSSTDTRRLGDHMMSHAQTQGETISVPNCHGWYVW